MGLLRKTLNLYAKLAPGRGRSLPPYEHVVQIGDPILRKVSEPVSVDKIRTDDIRKIIQKLIYVLDKYGSVGMAAPQVGVNLRIFIMRLTAKQIAKMPVETIKLKNMTVVPLTVFVNPKLKVFDYNKVIHSEGCESIRSFSADVARYNEVQVTGYNADGEEILRVFKGWSARIAQHEMDHLDGKLYTDIMDRKSLHCTCWDEVNLSKGKIVIPYSP
ncbi:peptide deformylase, mitochondrial-like isoform X1 [Nymphalis io]|uniref:peptide deformylase, mitochondrial-like isoform X1 n=1 Tax=Inachis io TaxID=171585 RepID=UPI00216884B8|nr:peptide deformylase, mitochondrial-like isoform X1 [Nymphalis io]